MPRSLTGRRNRLLGMHRQPDGIESGGFFRKDVPDYFSERIERATLAKDGGTVDYILPNNGATLAYIAGKGCITPHLGLAGSTGSIAPAG